MNAESGYLGGSRILQILRAFGEYMREPADQTGVAVCGADRRQDAGSGTAKRGHAAGGTQRQIIYQANVTTGKPDFLYVDEECPLILDTKYKPRYGAGTFDVDDIRQLAGYARDRKVLKRLGIQEAEVQDSAVVTCVIIFPEVRGVERPRHARKLKGVRFIWPILIQETQTSNA